MPAAKMKVYQDWDRVWQSSPKPTRIGCYSLQAASKKVREVLSAIALPKDSAILDMGCGSGRTLRNFREWGFVNCIGIDYSPQSIAQCAGSGFTPDKDVFQMDGANTTFADDQFDLVFSEGLLEHFADFSDFIREMARISRRYVCIVQPNHFSFYGKILHLATDVLRKKQSVKEFTYHLDDFVNSYRKNGFELKLMKATPLGEFMILLFEKNSGVCQCS